MPGPAPTPSPMLRARGSWRANARREEPELPCKAPACPQWLSVEAKAEWRRQVKHLEAMGVVAEIDRPMLAAFCEAWAEFVQAAAFIAEHGHIITTEKGYVLPHPQVAIKNSAVERLKAIGQQFGFSPAARTRLRTGKQAQSPVAAKGRFFRIVG